MKRKYIVLLVIFSVLLSISIPVNAQTTTAIKLFDATPVTGGGAVGPIVLFKSTTIDLTVPAGAKMIVSSTPDGTGGIVVDNFMAVNGTNVCTGNSDAFFPSRRNCFTRYTSQVNNNIPVEAIFKPIPPIDVTSNLVNGSNTFELFDFGQIYGNTELYLVTIPAPTEQSASCPVFYDGRINNCDAAAPVVVYPYQDESGDGLEIYDTDGNQILIVTADEIALVGDSPAENTLIADIDRLNLRVYRLSSGEFQVMASQYNGKTYVLIFDAPYTNIGYQSFEE